LNKLLPGRVKVVVQLVRSFKTESTRQGGEESTIGREDTGSPIIIRLIVSFITSTAPSAASEAVAYLFPAPDMLVEWSTKYNVLTISSITERLIIRAATRATPLLVDSRL